MYIINTQIDIPFTISGAPMEKVSEFSLTTNDCANSGIRNRIRKAQQTCGQLKTIWNTCQLSTQSWEYLIPLLN